MRRDLRQPTENAMPANVRPLFAQRVPNKNPAPRAPQAPTKQKQTIDWQTIAITAAIASMAGALAVGFVTWLGSRAAAKLTGAEEKKRLAAEAANPPQVQQALPPTQPQQQPFANLQNPYLIANLAPPAFPHDDTPPPWFQRWQENERRRAIGEG